MKNKLSLVPIALILIFSGCSKIKDFGDTNIDPSTTRNPVPSALLTGSLAAIPDWSVVSCGMYCQYFSETQYPSFSLYSSNLSSPMGYYSGALFDLQNIINVNTDTLTKAEAGHYGTNENQIAIARILKAYIFWNVTNLWGDIPYTDALKGNPDVDYDTQESIFKDLLKELSEAAVQFKTGDKVLPVQGDIAFNSDMSKWKKLANSMRMLIALNMSKQYPDASGYAATEFRAALNDPAGSVSDNSDNFRLDYPGGSAYRNPYYDMYNGAKYQGESSTFTSLLIDTIGSDDRQSVFGADISGAYSTLGVPYGRDRVYTDAWCQNNPSWSLIFAPYYRTQTSPVFLITASNVLLARAEAADRGWTTEIVSELYKAGINASFTQWGLQEPDPDYFLKGAVMLGLPGTNLKQIALQEYIAFYPDGLKGWTNWRRTGWPALIPAPDAINFPPVIPRRFMYGTDDYALTARGVAEAVARLAPNGDKMDSRVWWDKE